MEKLVRFSSSSCVLVCTQRFGQFPPSPPQVSGDDSIVILRRTSIDPIPLEIVLQPLPCHSNKSKCGQVFATRPLTCPLLNLCLWYTRQSRSPSLYHSMVFPVGPRRDIQQMLHQRNPAPVYIYSQCAAVATADNRHGEAAARSCLSESCIPPYLQITRRQHVCGVDAISCSVAR